MGLVGLKKLNSQARGRTKVLLLTVVIFLLAGLLFMLLINITATKQSVSTLQILALKLDSENQKLKMELISNLNELESLKNEDQYKVNIALRAKIADIEKTYTKAVSVYEELLKLKDASKASTAAFDNQYTDSLVFLAKQDYENADKSLTALLTDISAEHDKIVSSFTIPVSAVATNEAPSSGYRQQRVNIDIGSYFS